MATETIKIQEDISLKVSKASKLLGIKKEELIDGAILLYLDNLEKYIELKKEMKDWDKLSDEAFLKFEKSLS